MLENAIGGSHAYRKRSVSPFAGQEVLHSGKKHKEAWKDKGMKGSKKLLMANREELIAWRAIKPSWSLDKEEERTISAKKGNSLEHPFVSSLPRSTFYTKARTTRKQDGIHFRISGLADPPLVLDARSRSDAATRRHSDERIAPPRARWFTRENIFSP